MTDTVLYVGCGNESVVTDTVLYVGCVMTDTVLYVGCVMTDTVLYLMCERVCGDGYPPARDTN